MHEAIISQAQALTAYSEFLVRDAADPQHGGRHWGTFAAVVGHGHGGPAAARAVAAALPRELARRMPPPLPDGADRYSPETVDYAARARMAATAAFLAAAQRGAAAVAAPVACAPAAAAVSPGDDPSLAPSDLDPTGRAISPPTTLSTLGSSLSSEEDQLAAAAAAGAALVAAAAAAATAAGPARPQPFVTATLVVQTGQLLTVVNVGACRAVLDVGVARVELTEDDQLGSNEDEDARLAAANAHIAQLRPDLSGPCAAGEKGCGPLRVWPGGARYSRSIWCGPDAGGCAAAVVPYPHVRQVWLPLRACRLIVGTDNLWAAFETHHKAAALIQNVSASNAAATLLNHPARKGYNRRADMSALVVDFVPRGADRARGGGAAAPRGAAGSRGGKAAAAAAAAGRAAAGPDESSFKRQVRLDRLSRQSRDAGDGAAARPSAAVLAGMGGSSTSLASWGRSAGWDSSQGGGGGGGGGAAGASGPLLASPNSSWPPGGGTSVVAPPTLARWSMLAGGTWGAGGGGAAARSALRRTVSAAAATPERRLSARALLALLTPQCLAPRTVGGGAGIPTDPGGSIRAGGSFISLTVARMDTFEAYAGGRYSSPATAVLAALDAGLRAAASGSDPGAKHGPSAGPPVPACAAQLQQLHQQLSTSGRLPQLPTPFAAPAPPPPSSGPCAGGGGSSVVKRRVVGYRHSLGNVAPSAAAAAGLGGPGDHPVLRLSVALTE